MRFFSLGVVAVTCLLAAGCLLSESYDFSDYQRGGAAGVAGSSGSSGQGGRSGQGGVGGQGKGGNGGKGGAAGKGGSGAGGKVTGGASGGAGEAGAGEAGAGGDSGGSSPGGQAGEGGAPAAGSAGAEPGGQAGSEVGGAPAGGSGGSGQAGCATTVTLYLDGDGDGFGQDAQAKLGCEPEAGWATKGGDCLDTNADVNPKQKDFFVAPYPNAQGQLSYDYDCSGAEENSPKAQSAPDCSMLAADMCKGEGYAATMTPGLPGGNVLCGSSTLAKCEKSGPKGMEVCKAKLTPNQEVIRCH